MLPNSAQDVESSHLVPPRVCYEPELVHGQEEAVLPLLERDGPLGSTGEQLSYSLFKTRSSELINQFCFKIGFLTFSIKDD